jgi:hypothetical protein
MLFHVPVQIFLNMHSIYVVLFLLIFSCQQKGGEQTTAFAYNLHKPDLIYYMPDVLKEISGIQFRNENMLTCIEDNHGILYFYDTEKKEITDETEFESKGDYEDLAIVEKEYYVLKSNGIIHRISLPNENIEYKTTLNRHNNTEGLCYDPKNNRLLIACKDEGGPGLKKHEKGIYSFSLQDYKLSETPLIIIDPQKLAKVKDYTHLSEFSPSGIAICPTSNNLFVISSKGNLLLELNQEGKILFVEKLSDELFPQPEGICFSSSGDLIISNEGKEGSATILRFKAK